MSKNLISYIVIGLVVILLIPMSAFTVNEREQAVLVRGGKIVDAELTPGLHWKIPLYDVLVKYERRLLTLDSQKQRILTGEKMNLIVDFFVMWRIVNPREFYLTYPDGLPRAGSQLQKVATDGLQKELNARTMKQVVSDDRDVVMKNVTASVNQVMGKHGIEIVDVRIKRIELEEEVLKSVFAQMRAERGKVASQLRAEGEKQAKIIRAEAERKRVELLADAKRKAEIIRGEGDAKATEIYARAYSQDKEFYSFYRSLQGYRTTFNSKDDVIVLEPDSEFFKYFGSSK